MLALVGSDIGGAELADIFISYARTDRGKIETLASALERDGYSVWWDRQIVGGAEFSEEIEKELAAAKAVIACWSKESSKSRWVKDEAGIAASDSKLIALSLDSAEPPIGFKQFHSIDYANDTKAGYADLKRAIDAKLTGKAPTAPAPTRSSPTKLSAPLIAGGLALLGAIIAAVFILTRSSDAPDIALDGDPSIAVLPFADMSAAGDQEYFGDGIAEEILNLLAKSPELKVAGRTSSFQYKNKNEDLRSIGENLNVAHLLEGSVRKFDDKLRITAQLIRASDGFHIWSETYDGNITDIFAVQEKIAKSIAGELETSLGIGAGSQAKARTESIEAYEYYLRGLGHYASRGERGNDVRGGNNSVSDAIVSFEKTVALDPEFAAAWAGLSLSYVVAPGWLETHEGQKVSRVVYNRKALFAANRAIELNPNLAVSQHALANVMMQNWQWERAEDALLKALSLEPNSHVILEDYREFLSKVQRVDEAVIIARRMVELEPKNIAYLENAIVSELAAGNYELALSRENQLNEFAENFSDEYILLGLEYTAGIMHAMGKIDEANAYVTNCSKCSPEAKAYVLALLEQAENPSADFQIEALKFNPQTYFTIMTGNAERYIDRLEDDFATGGVYLFYALAYNIGDIGSDPRFKPLIKDAGLVRYWNDRGWPEFCRPLISEDGGEDDFECGEAKQ